MPNSSAKRSAAPWLRDPTETATPESVSRRSVTNVLAIPPVPRIPHRTGLSATSSSLRRPVPVISLFEGRGLRLEEHLPLRDWPARSVPWPRGPAPVAWPRCSPPTTAPVSGHGVDIEAAAAAVTEPRRRRQRPGVPATRLTVLRLLVSTQHVCGY